MSLEKTWWLLLDVVSCTRLDTMFTTWLLAQSNNSTSNKRPRKKLILSSWISSACTETKFWKLGWNEVVKWLLISEFLQSKKLYSLNEKTALF
jgi:hypothetical protein